MIVELAVFPSSSAKNAPSPAPSSIRAGGPGQRCGWRRTRRSRPKVKLTSQTRTTSPSFSGRRPFDFLRLIVQKRAVAAAQVFELVVVPFADDLAVVAADGADLDHDMAIGVAAQNPLVALELIFAAGLRSVVRQQVKHVRESSNDAIIRQSGGRVEAIQQQPPSARLV